MRDRVVDSSGSVYARLMDIERELVLEHFDAIRDGSYTAKSPATEGNLNLKRISNNSGG